MNVICSICSENYDNDSGSDWRSTPCGHTFHRHCLITWLNCSTTCPECRHSCLKTQLRRVYLNLAPADTPSSSTPSNEEAAIGATVSQIKSSNDNKDTCCTCGEPCDISADDAVNFLHLQDQFDCIRDQLDNVHQEVQRIFKELVAAKEKLSGRHQQHQEECDNVDDTNNPAAIIGGYRSHNWHGNPNRFHRYNRGYRNGQNS